MTQPSFTPATPLSPQQMAEMDIARKAMKSIRRAVFMAYTDGWSLAVFGGLTILFGYSSVTALLVGAGLCVVAYIELTTAPKLKKLDPSAAKILAFNQVALASILILYACWNLLFPPTAHDVMGSLSPELKAQVGDIDSQLDSVFSMGVHLLYFTLIAVAVFGQGSLALTYYRRIKKVKDYLANTPVWIVQMQQAGFSL